MEGWENREGGREEDNRREGEREREREEEGRERKARTRKSCVWTYLLENPSHPLLVHRPSLPSACCFALQRDGGREGGKEGERE